MWITVVVLKPGNSDIVNKSRLASIIQEITNNLQGGLIWVNRPDPILNCTTTLPTLEVGKDRYFQFGTQTDHRK